MRNNKLHRWFLSLLPLFTSSIAAFILKSRFEQLPVLQTRIDIASAAIFLGLAISLLLMWNLNKNIRFRQKLANQLEEENNEHKQFLLRLDHELKNPLSAIKTSLALMGQQLNDLSPDNKQDELNQTVHQIDAQTDRINHLISDLRKLSELETYLIELYPVNIHLLLEQTVSDFKSNPKSQARKISLSLPSAPWQLPDITTDEDLVMLCISNLVDNALKYTRHDGTIEIRAYENNNYVFVEIADNGIGIPETELEKVWRKLYRARNSRGMPGNGLGLSIVKTIVERLNGMCHIRSQEGIGTVFVLQLPK